jgi:hypothetical protein
MSHHHHTCSPHTSTACFTLTASSGYCIRFGTSIEHAEYAHGFHHHFRQVHVLHTPDGGFGSGQLRNARHEHSLFENANAYDFQPFICTLLMAASAQDNSRMEHDLPLLLLHTLDGGFGSGQFRNAVWLQQLYFSRWYVGLLVSCLPVKSFCSIESLHICCWSSGC